MNQNDPIAILYGEPVLEIPKDLFIPPNALHIILTEFEGPLDLLLYLIKKQNLDILNIPMVLITKQYLQYIEGLEQVNFELASEYLLMASMLLDIKSRMMLPKVASEEESEEVEDPRSELVRRLIEYEMMKSASEKLNTLPHAGRDFLWACLPVEKKVINHFPEVSIETLQMAWLKILNRNKNFQHHQVERSKVTVQEQSSFILSHLKSEQEFEFDLLFFNLPNVQVMVVTFIALLELIKNGVLRVRQAKPLAPIFVKKFY